MDLTNAYEAGVYGSCFDKPTADDNFSGSGNNESSSEWGELSSATAALLDPTVLKMFVESLTRSITGTESPSILSLDPVETPASSSMTGTPATPAAPQVTTPMSTRGSGAEYTPSPGGATGPGGMFRRSATSGSLLSMNSETSKTASTVMLRNVPYDARQKGVLSLLEEEGFKGRFDFFYAPLDFKSKNNLGYAFVNLLSVDIAKEFFKHFDGKRVNSRPGWDKPLRVCWARVQGLEANIDHYKNSPVNEMPIEFKPMLFEPSSGQLLLFPAPDTIHRSITNGSESKSTACGATGCMMPLQSSNRSISGLSSSTVRPRERRLQSQLSRGFLTPGNQGPSLQSSILTRTPQTPNTSACKLFVVGLSHETSSEILAEYMRRFGQVDDCHVLVDSASGRSRCYGFCTFRHPDGAQSALAYPKTHWVDGRGVVVRPYTSSQVSSPRHL